MLYPLPFWSPFNHRFHPQQYLRRLHQIHQNFPTNLEVCRIPLRPLGKRYCQVPLRQKRLLNLPVRPVTKSHTRVTSSEKLLSVDTVTLYSGVHCQSPLVEVCRLLIWYELNELPFLDCVQTPQQAGQCKQTHFLLCHFQAKHKYGAKNQAEHYSIQACCCINYIAFITVIISDQDRNTKYGATMYHFTNSLFIRIPYLYYKHILSQLRSAFQPTFLLLSIL